MYWSLAKYPGPNSGLIMITVALSCVALMVANAAFVDSSRDGKVLQAQLAELKKISQMLESKE